MPHWKYGERDTLIKISALMFPLPIMAALSALFNHNSRNRFDLDGYLKKGFDFLHYKPQHFFG